MLFIFKKYSIENFINLFFIQLELLDSIREKEKKFKHKEEEKLKKISDSSYIVSKIQTIVKEDEILPSQIYKLNSDGTVEIINQRKELSILQK